MKKQMMQTSMLTTHRMIACAALLLMASTALAQVNNVPFKGAFDGHESDVVQGGSLIVDGSGAGTASYIGRFTYTWKVTVDLASGLTTGGKFQLLAANGDAINGFFVGRGVPTDTPNVNQIVELATISGGTGRFQGATGIFTMNRLVDLTTGLTSGSVTGTISIPAPTK